LKRSLIYGKLPAQNKQYVRRTASVRMKTMF